MKGVSADVYVKSIKDDPKNFDRILEEFTKRN